MKIRSVKADMFHSNRRTNGQTWRRQLSLFGILGTRLIITQSIWINWVVKNSVVDANGMHNNHCEYDTVIIIPPARYIYSQFNFPFNWKTRHGRTIYSDVWHSTTLKENAADKIAVWIALPSPVQLIANLSAIYGAQLATRRTEWLTLWRLTTPIGVVPHR